MVSVDRDKDYGPPATNLTNIARLWSAYLEMLPNSSKIGPDDVAILNILQKIARTQGPEVSADTYIDMAGYAAIAYECVVKCKTKKF
jgi:hypothetical protein